MNERFRFRAWDLELKDWYYWDINDYPPYPLMSKKGGEKSIVIMQSTGLCDKNGVLIYENDLVLCDDGGEYFPEEYDEEKDEYFPVGVYKIVWGDHGGWWLEDIKTGMLIDMDYSPFSVDSIEMEVTGNIYEKTPERKLT